MALPVSTSCAAPGRLVHTFSETQVGSLHSPHLRSPPEVAPPSGVGCLSQMSPAFGPQARFRSGCWHGRLVPRTHGEGRLLSPWVTSVLSDILVSEAGHAPWPSSSLKTQPFQTPESLPSGRSPPPSLHACLATLGCAPATGLPPGPERRIYPGPLRSQAPLPFPDLRALQGSSVKPSSAHLSLVPPSPAVFGGPQQTASLTHVQRGAATSGGPQGCLEYRLAPRRFR